MNQNANTFKIQFNKNKFKYYILNIIYLAFIFLIYLNKSKFTKQLQNYLNSLNE